jgi:hypothetical protein
MPTNLVCDKPSTCAITVQEIKGGGFSQQHAGVNALGKGVIDQKSGRSVLGS